MSYKHNIVRKPWGHEYLAYENDECALWFLHIKNNERTSMHCHPNKTTGLVLLDGKATVSFLNDENPLSPISKIMIRKGLFHSTRACHEKGAFVFEIETPVDKEDLVRLRDNYGREGTPYEDSTHEYSKEKETTLWIENPPPGESNTYSFCGARLEVRNITSVDALKDIQESTNVMFLQGGITTDYGVGVAAAGDVIAGKVIKLLLEVFDKVKNDTIIMIMERE
jgi:mannose-6-phosphate isomerase-like protein (cupin superfamily)